MSAYSFTVRGAPAPKGSRTPGVRKNGTIFTRPASKKEKAWVEAVAQAAMTQPVRLTQPPFLVEMTFWMPRPKRPSHPYPTRGDVDKLVRGCLDGLQFGDAIPPGDAHVVEIRARKEWAPEPGAEGALIRIAETS